MNKHNRSKHDRKRRHNRKRGLMERYDVCEKTIDRRVKEGKLPKPDFYVGPIPYWTDETLDRCDAKAAERTKEAAA